MLSLWIAFQKISAKISILFLMSKLIRMRTDPSSLKDLIRSSRSRKRNGISVRVEVIPEVGSKAKPHREKAFLIGQVNASLFLRFAESSLVWSFFLLAAPFRERPFPPCSLDKKEFALFVETDDADNVFCVFT